MEPKHACKVNFLSFISDIEGARSIFTSQLPSPSPAECEQKETDKQLVSKILHQFGVPEIVDGYWDGLQDRSSGLGAELNLDADYWHGMDALERV